MRKIILLLFMLSLLWKADAQQIITAEYFFDQDPGAGNGTALTITSADTAQFIGNIPTTGLSNGFHVLYVRAKNAAGKWSLYEKRSFYIQPIRSAAQNNVAAEYFIDQDPGVGNGTPLTVSPADTLTFSGTISTVGLSNGFHVLCIRAKNADGKWSLYERRAFFVQPAAVAVQSNVEAEYFIDQDPGSGNGTPFTVLSGDTISLSTNITTSSLGEGFHKLAIRTKDSNGKWGLYETRTFAVQNLRPALPILVAAEYFVNNDPGEGNGSSLSVTPGDSIVFNGGIPIALTDSGYDTLYIRVKDQAGNWSFYESRVFQISLNVGIADLSEGNNKLYQNFPNPFSSETMIEFDLVKQSDFTLQITDMLGNLVKEFRDSQSPPGHHIIRLNAEQLSSGYYTYRLSTSGFTDTKRMIIAK